jgi:hypothetical protein
MPGAADGTSGPVGSALNARDRVNKEVVGLNIPMYRPGCVDVRKASKSLPQDLQIVRASSLNICCRSRLYFRICFHNVHLHSKTRHLPARWFVNFASVIQQQPLV